MPSHHRCPAPPIGPATGHAIGHAIRGRFAVRGALAALVALLATLALSAPLAAPLAAQGGADAGVPAARAADAPRRPAHRHRTTRGRSRTSGRPATAIAAPYTTPHSSTALAADVGAMLQGGVRSGGWGALVVSLTRGDTLYSYQADAQFQPASTMKLFTTALALDQLGPEYRFSTDVLRDGALDASGVVSGDLYVRGAGDPGFSNRFLEGGPGAPVELLAQLVAAAGVRRVRGDLVADASAFADEPVPEGWQTRYLASGYAARVSALSLNENVVTVVVTPTPSGAVVALEPATTLPMRSSVRVARGSGARVVAYPASDGVIQVRGWIGARAGVRRYRLVVEDPAAFTAGAFRRALEARGVRVDGSIRTARTPDRAVRIATLPSPPLARLISAMNRESLNLFAELLFRDAARSAAPGSPASAEAANRLLQGFLRTDVGVAPGAVTAADGSGLSVLDRATPRALVQLLAYAHAAPWGDAFHASLPVAGESELLRQRMLTTPAAGNLHAKTGTTDRVISLAGYVTAENGEILAFAFLYNGTDRWNARATIDQVGATLAAFVRN